MHKKIFVSNVIKMSVSMIISNISALFYNIFISQKLGAETVGLFHLVGSVYSIGISFCVSGMSLTATRLLSDMPKQKGLASSDSIIAKCLSISLMASGIATALMYGFSNYIAKVFLSCPIAAAYIRKFSFSLTAISISAVITGYFTAFSKVELMSAGHLLGEATTWILTFLFLKETGDKCMAIVKSKLYATFIECITNIFFWRLSSRNIIKEKSKISYSYITRLCSPIALGSYLRTGLTSVENLLIPKRLSLISNDALSKYGILKGMTMPILFFPSVFIGAFTSLLVPEIARRFSQKQINSVRYVSSLGIFSIIKFGVCVSAVFLIWGNELAEQVFHLNDAGKYLQLLSFLPLLMYIDSVTDTVLKGINEQVFSLKLNTYDAIFRVILVIFCVPIFGIRAYIAILYISEIFNLSLSFWRLKKITALRFSFGKAAISAFTSLFCALVIIYFIHPQNLISRILIFSASFFMTSEIFSNLFEKAICFNRLI